MLNSMNGRRVCSVASAAARMVAVAGLSMGMVLCGGCETTGGSGGGGSSGRGASSAPPVQHDAWSNLGYRLDWRGFASVPRGRHVTSVALGSDVVVVQESGSRVTVLESSNGSIRWTNELATRLTRFPSLDVLGDRVLASSESELLGLDVATGAVVTRQRFPRVVNTPSLIAGGVALYGTSSGEVLAHVLSSGVKLWGFQLPGAVEHGAVSVNGLAGVVSQSGDAVFLDPQSGTLYGRHRMFKGTRSAPASGDGAMYVASLDQSLWAFEPGDVVRWRFRTEHALENQPVFHDGAVYLDVPRMGLVAIDARTGARRWAAEGVAGTVVAQRNGMLVVFAPGGVTLVDPMDGTVVGREAIADVVRIVPDGFVDGALYAVSASGTVSRFLPRR